MTTTTKNKKRVTLTAEDRDGRTESITLMLDNNTAERLMKATAYETWSDDYDLKAELNRMYDVCREQLYFRREVYFTRSQWYRLRDFFYLTYHKFYNYTLSIRVYGK